MFSAPSHLGIVCLSAAALFKGPGASASAGNIVYRFEGERSGSVIVQLPEGSIAAQVAAMQNLSGTFGYEIGARVEFEAGIPGQVAFAAYDTGFIRIDGLELSQIIAVPEISVTDGMTRMDDPRMTIADAFSISLNPGVTDTPADYLSLNLRFADAVQWQSTDLPVRLDFEHRAQAHLRFSVLVGKSDISGGIRSGATEVLGTVSFVITAIERAE